MSQRPDPLTQYMIAQQRKTKVKKTTPQLISTQTRPLMRKQTMPLGKEAILISPRGEINESIAIDSSLTKMPLDIIKSEQS